MCSGLAKHRSHSDVDDQRNLSQPSAQPITCKSQSRSSGDGHTRKSIQVPADSPVMQGLHSDGDQQLSAQTSSRKAQSRSTGDGHTRKSLQLPVDSPVMQGP